MSDLELRLRNRAKGYEVGPATFALLNDAADRIAQLEAVVEAVPESHLLVALADWIDLKHPEYDSDEVQQDLRKLASALAILEQTEETG